MMPRVSRRYNSPLREAKAEETRASLLAATEALLVEGPVDEVTIPSVARRAGVSAPTAYKYFPTTDDLMKAFIEQIRPRLGLSMGELGAVSPEALPATTRRNYRRFERFRELIRTTMSSPTWDRIRHAERIDRASVVEPLFEASSLSRRDLRAALGAVYVFMSPRTWRWLRETWGLSSADAARAAAWAVSVLVRELQRSPSSLDPLSPDPTDPEEPSS